MYIGPINLLYKESPGLEKIEHIVTGQLHEIDDAIDKNISDQCIQIAYEYGIDINKEDLIAALKADRRRYEEAYSRGYSAGRCDALRELDSYKNTGMWEVPNNDEL
jgi:hypothetical protein